MKRLTKRTRYLAQQLARDAVGGLPRPHIAGARAELAAYAEEAILALKKELQDRASVYGQPEPEPEPKPEPKPEPETKSKPKSKSKSSGSKSRKS